jgi:hypothetical protein
MEAVAKYAYTASSTSELSFEANDTMNVSASRYLCDAVSIFATFDYSFLF